MDRNEIESDFRTSNMATGSHFVKIFIKIKNLYWSKMARIVIQSEFRTSKMADGSHFVKIRLNMDKNDILGPNKVK